MCTPTPIVGTGQPGFSPRGVAGSPIATAVSSSTSRRPQAFAVGVRRTRLDADGVGHPATNNNDPCLRFHDSPTAEDFSGSCTPWQPPRVYSADMGTRLQLRLWLVQSRHKPLASSLSAMRVCRDRGSSTLARVVFCIDWRMCMPPTEASKAAGQYLRQTAADAVRHTPALDGAPERGRRTS
jgi:hypothetical protein